MRFCTPILVGTRAAGINRQVRTAPRRARRGAIVNPQAPSHADPRTARRHEGAGARQSVFSLWTVHGPFLFWQDQIWGPRRAPRGGERRSKGAGAVFAVGGNGA